MSDGEVRDQLMTLLVAGHETTRPGSRGRSTCLTRHPESMGRPGQAATPTCARSWRSRCGCARSCRSPAAGSHGPRGRRCCELPAGTDVTPAIGSPHPPGGLPGPYAFRPERFLDAPPATYTWIPYGGGVRRCLGAPFAEIEMRVVLDEILTPLRHPPRRPPRRGHRPPQRHVLAPPRHPHASVRPPRCFSRIRVSAREPFSRCSCVRGWLGHSRGITLRPLRGGGGQCARCGVAGGAAGA